MAQKTNTDTGKPSGVDKPMQGTGVPANVSDESRANDQRLTDDYTVGDEEIADGIREMNPNRNVDKTDATNAGGYRN
jgi:hypothetical protein